MHRTVLALALCASFTAHADGATLPTNHGTDAKSQLQILEVSINKHPTHLAVSFQTDGAVLTANVGDWKSLGVVLRGDETGKSKLTSTELGATIYIDEDAQTVDIELPLDRLPKQVLNANGKVLEPMAPSAKGLLINYDLSVAKSFPENYEGASLEHDLHYPLFGGVLETSGQLNYNTNDGVQYKRLYTSWEKDNYTKLTTWQVGDVFAIGPASTTTNLMGMRWTKDPAGLDPNTPTWPLPTINGLVADAGTLEVLANQQALSKSDVQKGPFQIDQIQAQSGLNQLQAVVDDGYGRQTVVSAGSYYVAPTMLRPGLDTWDFSAGLIRRSYTDKYEGFGANFRYSKGLSDWTTTSYQAQVSNDGIDGAGTIVQKLGNYGVVTATGALSYSVMSLPNTALAPASSSPNQKGLGWYGSIGYSYQTGNFGVHVQRSQQSDNFYQLHDPSLTAYQPIESTLVGASWTSPNRTFGAQLNYNELKTNYSRFKQVIGNASWSSGRHHLNLSFGYDLSHHTPTAMFTYTYAFKGGGVSASGGMSDGQQQEQISGYYTHQWQSDYLQANGTLSRLSTGTMLNSSVNLTTNLGAGRLGVEAVGNTGAVNMDWNGALLVGGGIHMLKNTPDGEGYALIDVPGVANLPVTVNGRIAGTTNSQGVAAIGGIPSLLDMQFGVSDKDIPMGVDLGDTKTTARIAKLGGASVQFKVETMDARAFKLQYQGKDVVVGATDEAGDMVGYHGALFLEHPPIGKDLVFKNTTMRCTVHIPNKLPPYGKPTLLDCK